MNQESAPKILAKGQGTLGARVRQIADQLKEESDLQIKVTSRILGAAAQIAQNHDRLIEEVVEMVEEDLDQKQAMGSSNPSAVNPSAVNPSAVNSSAVNSSAVNSSAVKTYTVEELKKQFKTLNQAKTHFGIKASSWDTLINKLNPPSVPNQPTHEQPSSEILERLANIEQDLVSLRSDTHQILVLLQRLIPNTKEF
jgi:Mg2+ and Co2+ transporter CorA